MRAIQAKWFEARGDLVPNLSEFEKHPERSLVDQAIQRARLRLKCYIGEKSSSWSARGKEALAPGSDGSLYVVAGEVRRNPEVCTEASRNFIRG